MFFAADFKDFIRLIPQILDDIDKIKANAIKMKKLTSLTKNQ